MRRLGENRWENRESSWLTGGISRRDQWGRLLETMVGWALWQRILCLVVLLAVLIAGELLLSLWVQGWPSLKMVKLPVYGYYVSNCLFLFWISTFPKWELERRKKLATRFSIITFCICAPLMFIAFFWKLHI